MLQTVPNLETDESSNEDITETDHESDLVTSSSELDENDSDQDFSKKKVSKKTEDKSCKKVLLISNNI